ncbi:hypothetical protein [Xanthomonas citri]|nr:hypothetical protein [Xanthomonas citri]MCT8356024.1 hypothetical protein [Xanthomonas citri pv. anacardii]MCT8361279.1 hypothetical protein [Xanthomonas citri pv. anacardii]MCT8363496.1 hypothetical protein [Xanthomonas citri pv. anacardii]MCT8369218.1 hypothetical protein [Xanthomonas citri pv. anacardii]MCT8380430.1 hypothetical protein [Xanthomonas citri pv. anacardii]
MRQRWGDVRRSLEWLERVAPICCCDCYGCRCCISFIGMWVSGADGLDGCRLCLRVLVIDACVRRRHPPVYPGKVSHPASRHGVNPSSKLAGGIHATNGPIPDALHTPAILRADRQAVAAARRRVCCLWIDGDASRVLTSDGHWEADPELR